jgi:hypothetical protein
VSGAWREQGKASQNREAKERGKGGTGKRREIEISPCFGRVKILRKAGAKKKRPRQGQKTSAGPLYLVKQEEDRE